MRHSRFHSRSRDISFINIVNGVSIHERSKNINNRKSLGHWEGDLVSGSCNTHIATLVDRKSRYTIILKLAGKDASSVHAALLNTFTKMPIEYRKSLIWDRGMELAKHADLTIEIGLPVYFCDPQCPWQRGTNENTNSLIRQYFPKKTDLSLHSQERLNEVATQLNQRPRKTLKFKTPSDMIEKSVAIITLIYNGSLDVGLAVQFTIIEALKGSHAVKRCCDVSNTHRSSYKYWANQVRHTKPVKVKSLAMVKNIYTESNSSAGARTILVIATKRLGYESLCCYSFDERARLSQLSAT
jgi:hypothetical protein